MRVTEKEWLSEISPYLQFHFIDKRECDSRRLRLFWCACCRRVWNLLQLNASKRLVELSEAYADDEIKEAELLRANASAEFEDMDAQSEGEAEAARQLSASSVDAINATRRMADQTLDSFSLARKTSSDSGSDFIPYPGSGFGVNVIVGRDEVEWVVKLRLLRDIFGNPFRPVTFDPIWRTETTTALAQGAYEERFLPSGELDIARLSILADALEEAGCDNEEILTHLRSPGPHVRGCWALDLVLGKT